MLEGSHVGLAVVKPGPVAELSCSGSLVLINSGPKHISNISCSHRSRLWARVHPRSSVFSSLVSTMGLLGDGLHLGRSERWTFTVQSSGGLVLLPVPPPVSLLHSLICRSVRRLHLRFSVSPPVFETAVVVVWCSIIVNRLARLFHNRKANSVQLQSSLELGVATAHLHFLSAAISKSFCVCSSDSTRCLTVARFHHLKVSSIQPVCRARAASKLCVTNVLCCSSLLSISVADSRARTV